MSTRPCALSLFLFLTLTSTSHAADGPTKLTVSQAKYIADPIPASDILKGKPVAKLAAMHTDPDKKYSVGVWTCTPGSFRWTCTRDEFVYILEGVAVITYKDGKSITVKPGDAAYCPAGETTWTVVKAVKKIYALRE